MNRIIYNSSYHPKKPIRKRYSLLIPAAGKGSRLGYSKAKILCPIKNKLILNYVIDPFLDYVDEINIIVSPKEKTNIEKEISSYKNHCDVRLIIQKNPIGMAHALSLSEKKTSFENVIVIWGDQVGFKNTFIYKLLCLHEFYNEAVMTLPTYLKKKPYINIKRDEKNKIIYVEESREGTVSSNFGENDLGLFIFRKEILFEVIKNKMKKKVGGITKEYNLLPMFPEFQKLGFVNTLRIKANNNIFGINDIEDLKKAEEKLNF